MIEPSRDISIVIGVDARTLPCLQIVYPTWAKYKPSLFAHPWCVIYDAEQVTAGQIQSVAPGLTAANFATWPPTGIVYERDNLTKWTNSQRAKMLAGFVHVPANNVQTDYWLKLDLDVVATGQDDWINPDWFVDNPSIVAPAWSYSKPADTILKLDQWAARTEPLFLRNTEPLNLIPEPGAETLPHQRICSWCAFFSIEFTRYCSLYAHQTCGYGQIPIDSQDGYHFYCAKRGGFGIKTIRPKKCGWKLCHSPRAVRDFIAGMQ